MRDIRSMRRSVASIIHIWRRITTGKAVILPARLMAVRLAGRFKAAWSRVARFKEVRFKAAQLQISLFRGLFRAQELPTEAGHRGEHPSRDRQDHRSRRERRGRYCSRAEAIRWETGFQRPQQVPGRIVQPQAVMEQEAVRQGPEV